MQDRTRKNKNSSLEIKTPNPPKKNKKDGIMINTSPTRNNLDWEILKAKIWRKSVENTSNRLKFCIGRCYKTTKRRNYSTWIWKLSTTTRKLWTELREIHPIWVNMPVKIIILSILKNRFWKNRRNPKFLQLKKWRKMTSSWRWSPNSKAIM